MKYMGSKNRIAKHILPIMLKHRTDGQWWVEPFVGGGNMIDKVDGKRLGGDSNKHLIDCMILIRDQPESIPDIITEDDYTLARKDPSNFKSGLVGFIGFAMSFGGKYFGGYRRDVAGTKGCLDNMKIQTRRSKNSAVEQPPKLQAVKFVKSSYSELDIPDNSLIYCDPPYAKTTKYNDDFDHGDFWKWCRLKVSEGHTVFVSEYSAPDDFKSVWSKEIVSSLTKDTGSKKGVEQLFVHESFYDEVIST